MMSTHIQYMGYIKYAAIFVILFYSGRIIVADEIIADVDNHLVNITTEFDGANLIVFGALDSGDVIITIRGPNKKTTIRKKKHLFGLWVNHEFVTYDNVASFYFLATSNNAYFDLPQNIRDLYDIGIDNIEFNPVKMNINSDKEHSFERALINNFREQGLYREIHNHVVKLTPKFFRADIFFPPTTLTGAYIAEIFLVKNGNITTAQAFPIFINHDGIGAKIHEFAFSHHALFGILAIILALISGLVADFVFRKRS